MNSFFDAFTQPNVLWVLTGSGLLGACAGAIGCFLLLRRRALAGDVLAHASLPGVTTGFLIFHERSPEVLFIGALVSCTLAYGLIEFLIARSKIKQDSAYASILSLFFALGAFQLTSIQSLPLASQAGLDKLLFGQAAALVPSDIVKLAILAASTLAMIAVFFDRLKLVSFDRNYSRAVGVQVFNYEVLIALAVVSSVVVGIQLVGVVLLAALLVTPPAAARFWTERLHIMVLISSVFGALSGILGALASYIVPKLPSGPVMVLCASFAFLISFLFAPLRGVVPRTVRRFSFARKVQDENLLRTIYKAGESSGNFRTPVERGLLLRYRRMGGIQLERILERLNASGLVDSGLGGFTLTEAGRTRAERLTRVHRLWELYLSNHVNLPSDHVHDCAEEIEHIITPELEAQLLAELGESALDPHGKVIPRDTE